ncbi:MAG TPA: hypothetical protein VF732_03385 [Nitrospira sp.]
MSTTRRSRTVFWLVLGWLVGWNPTESVLAWVYPEHRDIAMLAVQDLDPQHREIFDRLWSQARRNHEPRLCEQGADVSQGLSPPCIDWAALSAIGGDHSCSSQEMAETIFQSTWILKVAEVAAQLKVDLARIDILPPSSQIPGDKSPIEDLRRRVETETARADRVNVLRKADSSFQRADSRYATRADSSHAHFLLARPRTDTSPKEYGALVMRPGSEINAVGVWGQYHLSALQKATRLAHEKLTPEERQRLVLSVLFDEAFALHFLEDMYSAGHIAGTWGSTPQRQGTHDFYNEAGLEVVLWLDQRQSVVLMGDAHMRPEDAERAATAVRISLEQVLDTATGLFHDPRMPYTPAAPLDFDTFDVCTHDTLGKRPEGLGLTPEASQLGQEVVRSIPMPGLGAGLGAIPRFRSEVGPFMGLAGMVDGRYISRGFTGSEGGGVIGGVDVSARIGMGLEGVLSESGDGLIFLAVGLRGDGSSTNSFSSGAVAQAGGNLSAAIPSHVGLSTRVRMPFYLIPGDLLLLAPLYFFAPEQYFNLAVTAGNGGLLGWQSGWATAIGRFQFVLGRELGVTFFGLSGKDRVFESGATPGSSAKVVDYRSIFFDLPVLEYRPFRAFSSNQSATLLVQLFTGVNIPYATSVALPVGAPGVDLKPVWSVGLRLLVDWRYYP